MLFLHQIQRLLQGMRCQTSTDYAWYRSQHALKNVSQRAVGGGGPFHALGATMLLWQDDLQSCYSAGMIPPISSAGGDAETGFAKGSLSLLWPLFLVICFSQFVETLSCTLQGRRVRAETGLTVFEHSLAFAEAEAVVSHQLGLGFFGTVTGNSEVQQSGPDKGLPYLAVAAVQRSAILSRYDTTPEVLFVGLISSCSHLTSHVLVLFGLQNRFRLWSTGFWGLTLKGVLSWGWLTFSAEPLPGRIDISQFPTVCIVGYVPHILTFMGICICAIIYLIALFLLALSPAIETQQASSFRERISMAQESLQANMHFSSMHIDRGEDFFNALLKVGFTALLAATEAVFLHEGRPISVRMWTWLEENRMRDVERVRAAQADAGSDDSAIADDDGSSMVVEGMGLKDTGRSVLPSGYGREKSTTELSSNEREPNRIRGSGGVGASERSARWLMVWKLFRRIAWLLIGWFVTAAFGALEAFGIRLESRWVRRLAYGKNVDHTDAHNAAAGLKPATLEFWLLSNAGELYLPPDDNVDVEAEMRKRIQRRGGPLTSHEERELDVNIYEWWKQGGWFGELDESGDYEPEKEGKDVNEDLAIDGRSRRHGSTEDAEWDTADDNDDDDDDGTLTPIQERSGLHSRDSSPLPNLARDVTRLAGMLNPKTKEEQQEAQMLSYRLQRRAPLTRSQYQRLLERERNQILTSAVRCRQLLVNGSNTITAASPSLTSAASTKSMLTTADEEAELLEHLILSRRSEVGKSRSESSNSATTGPSKTTTGNDSRFASWPLGAETLPCVVCQTSPRTILVWPCRCFSVCDDCRVSLAMNNFGSCVCCRREVLGFSRIYLP